MKLFFLAANSAAARHDHCQFCVELRFCERTAGRFIIMTDNAAQKASASYRLLLWIKIFFSATPCAAFSWSMEKAKRLGLGGSLNHRRLGSARALAPDPGVPHDPSHLSHWYEEARRFGRIASERGGALFARGGLRDNVIATGGPGIMEAANRGAAERAPSIGFNIGLPHEQEPNGYTTPDLTFLFHYFAVRKLPVHFLPKRVMLSSCQNPDSPRRPERSPH